MAWNYTFDDIKILKFYTEIFIMDDVMGSKASLFNKSFIVMTLVTTLGLAIGKQSRMEVLELGY